MGPAFRPACPAHANPATIAIRRCFSLQYRKASPCSLDREDSFQHLGSVRKFVQLRGSALPAISENRRCSQMPDGALIGAGVLRDLSRDVQFLE